MQEQNYKLSLDELARIEKPGISKNLINLLIQVSPVLVIIMSVAIITIIILLSVVLPIKERIALIQKTDDACKAAALGLSSISVEGITENKRDKINDYLNNLKLMNINGISSAQVIEYRKDEASSKDIKFGWIIGSLDYKDLDNIIPADKLNYLLNIKDFSKRTIQSANEVYYEYSYPVAVKVKDTETKTLLGAVSILFPEKDILKTYYESIKYTNQILYGSITAGILIVIFYLILTHLLKGKIEEVNLLNFIDSLTKIFNRKKFNEIVDYEVSRVKRYGNTLSLVMFDIDNFKTINETCGHDAGNIILANIAQLVKKLIRNTDFFARWGGEEFMILTPSTSKNEAADLSERIRVAVQEFNFPQVEKVTCSFGVSTFQDKPSKDHLTDIVGFFTKEPDLDDTIEDFLKRADTALHYAKEGGRNRVILQ